MDQNQSTHRTFPCACYRPDQQNYPQDQSWQAPMEPIIPTSIPQCAGTAQYTQGNEGWLQRNLGPLQSRPMSARTGAGGQNTALATEGAFGFQTGALSDGHSNNEIDCAVDELIGCLKNLDQRQKTRALCRLYGGLESEDFEFLCGLESRASSILSPPVTQGSLLAEFPGGLGTYSTMPRSTTRPPPQSASPAAMENIPTAPLMFGPNCQCQFRTESSDEPHMHGPEFSMSGYIETSQTSLQNLGQSSEFASLRLDSDHHPIADIMEA